MIDQILEGVSLMLVGMVTVTLFLTLLVIVMKLMSHFASNFVEPVTAEAANKNLPDEDTISAISAAIHHYRNKKK